MKKAWDAVVTAKDLYLEVIEWLGPAGTGTLWPASLIAVWWLL